MATLNNTKLTYLDVANSLVDGKVETKIVEMLSHAASDDPNNLGLWDRLVSQLADNRTDGAQDAAPDYIVEITFRPNIVTVPF